MIIIKSKNEIESMRKAGRIVAQTLQCVRRAIAPGVTTAKLNAIAHDFIVSQGAVPSFLGYGGFAGSICTSINEVVVHGIPGDRVLLEGDIISVDVGAKIEGFHGDSANTFPVGEISKEKLDLIRVTRESFFEGLKFAHEGQRLSDISSAVGDYAEKFGYGVVRSMCGHGVGRDLHEDPEIPNYGRPGHGPRLRSGMVLAVEPMINMGRWPIEIADDGWTASTCDGLPSAHYEHTFLITEGEPELLTVDPDVPLEETF